MWSPEASSLGRQGDMQRPWGSMGLVSLGTSRNRVERWKGGTEGEEGTLLGLNLEGLLGSRRGPGLRSKGDGKSSEGALSDLIFKRSPWLPCGGSSWDTEMEAGRWWGVREGPGRTLRGL